MTMLLNISFAKPLDRAARVRVRLALAGLAKAKAVWIDRTGWSATVAGEWLGAVAVRNALAAEDVAVAAVESSLTPEDDQRCEDAGPGERFRPAGR